jgi:hypothetical protein
LALGLTIFPALLGSSTGVDKTAAGDFYLRIAQILFAGLFTIYALMIVEHLLRPRFLKTVNNLLQVMFQNHHGHLQFGKIEGISLAESWVWIVSKEIYKSNLFS